MEFYDNHFRCMEVNPGSCQKISTPIRFENDDQLFQLLKRAVVSKTVKQKRAET